MKSKNVKLFTIMILLIAAAVSGSYFILNDSSRIYQKSFNVVAPNLLSAEIIENRICQDGVLVLEISNNTSSDITVTNLPHILHSIALLKYPGRRLEVPHLPSTPPGPGVQTFSLVKSQETLLVDLRIWRFQINGEIIPAGTYIAYLNVGLNGKNIEIPTSLFEIADCS